MTRKRTLLTIDWDYFIPEDPFLDMGHREAMLFIKDMWNIRACGLLARGVDYKEKIKTNGKEETFWKEIQEIFNIEDAALILTESHTSAYYIALDSKIDVIYSFDAHSDITYRGVKTLNGDVDCGNWLGNLATKSGKTIKKGYVIYPEETNESPEGCQDIIQSKKFKNRLEFLTLEQLKEQKTKTKVGLIHICRSGAWCPPWLDKAFYKFAKASGLRYYDADVVERDWDEAVEKRIEESAKQEKELLSNL